MFVKGMPFKVSFFLWRLFKFKLPVDDVVKRTKISIVSCGRCSQHPQHEETVPHLFLTGEFAMAIWQYYKGAAGNANLCLLAALEEEDCNNEWGNMSRSKLIYDINLNLHNLVCTLYPWLRDVPQNWPQIVQFLEGYKAKVGCRLVQWKSPNTGWYKCNADGASRGYPGESSAAYCVRNDRGDLVYAAATRLANTTNICAEATTISDGIECCITRQLTPVNIETDSLSMLNIIEGNWEMPWKISLEVKKIKHWSSMGQVQFAHILREGNALADFLTNSVFNVTCTRKIHSYQELVPEARKILNIDKSMMPCFRFRTYKEREPE
ncbi:uncharacterized protein LOC132053753 [Lycium ferocissimum]|uniref:uncharacterized protein LOC132053753 n=1 Tax=Lycium ferocissimum TaxID=112874 RepID=UPI0028149C7A|nr:uncharacterized protein LOC132053753 [Lycium ferocissimum]